MSTISKTIACSGFMVAALLLLMAYTSSIWVLMIEALAGFMISFATKKPSLLILGCMIVSATITMLYFVVSVFLYRLPGGGGFWGWIFLAFLGDFPFGFSFGLFASVVGTALGQTFQRRKTYGKDRQNAA